MDFETPKYSPLSLPFNYIVEKCPWCGHESIEKCMRFWFYKQARVWFRILFFYLGAGVFSRIQNRIYREKFRRPFQRQFWISWTILMDNFIENCMDDFVDNLTLIGMTLALPCPFWIRFCLLNFYPKFPNFLEVKININQVNMTPCQAHWVI